MRSCISALLVIALSPAFGAFAAPPPPSQDVVVVAPKSTVVAATYPADGASVPGGTLIVKVVFDHPMAADGWSYMPSDKGQFPRCLARPRLLADHRTFVLLCSLAVETTYALEINATAQFESTGGRKPPSYALTFKTTDAPTLGLHDALQAAGLTDADDPIMGAVAGGASVQSAPKTDDAGGL